MKKFKKLIPAFCMLLVSAIMLGSSTFAWFSMNTKVTASNMQVNAKTNTTFLLINNDGKTGNQMTAQDTTIAAQAPANTTLYPAAFFKTVDETTTMGKKDGTNAFKLIEDGKLTAGSDVWVTANNGNRDDANDKVANVVKLNPGETNFTNYTAEYKVWLTLLKGTAATQQYVKISLVADTEVGAAKAVAKIGEEWIDLGAGGEAKFTADKISLSDSTAVQVSVFVYIDGNNANVKSATDVTTITGLFALDFEIVETK